MNRFFYNIETTDEGPIAGWIECDVPSEAQATPRAVHRPKALERGVMGSASSAREPHHHDSSGVDSGMPSEKLQCAVRVEDHDLAAELILIVRRTYDASAGEAINNEGCDAECVELPRPIVL